MFRMRPFALWLVRKSTAHLNMPPNGWRLRTPWGRSPAKGMPLRGIAQHRRDEVTPFWRNQLQATQTARKRADSRASSAPPENEERPLSRKKPGRKRSMLQRGRHLSSPSGKAIETGFYARPWCTLVSGPDDRSTGGAGGRVPSRSRPDDPDYAERLSTLKRPGLPSTKDASVTAAFGQLARRLFGVNGPINFGLQITCVGFLELWVGRTHRPPADLIDNEPQTPLDKILPTTTTLVTDRTIR